MEMNNKESEQLKAQSADQAKEKVDYDQKVSMEEMEAVSGGKWETRDWYTDPCAATVEYDSWCWSNDFCFEIEVEYTNHPKNKARNQ